MTVPELYCRFRHTAQRRARVSSAPMDIDKQKLTTRTQYIRVKIYARFFETKRVSIVASN